MRIVTEDFLLELSYASQVKIPNDELEGLLISEENEHLRSPGIPAHYYRFFHCLIGYLAPVQVLELGSYTGISAYALADDNVNGDVVSLDHNFDRILDVCRECPGLRFVGSDSLNKIDINNIDVLFLDTLHDGQRCQGEFDLYKDDVVPGGLIFFDDVYLNDEMRAFWENFKPEGFEKFNLPVHGNAGFGCLIKARG